MNIHKLIDNFTGKIGALVAGENKFFAQSIESRPFPDHLENITMDLPEFNGKGKYILEADTLVGNLEIAFLVSKWKGNNYPSIIYHHGNNESPFDFGMFSKNSFQDIFIKNIETIDANLIAIRAPYHEKSLKEYKKKITELSKFMAMLSTSVILVNKLIDFISNEISSQTVVSGISLGGWVTNLHKTYFDTADTYVPLLAGAFLGDLFISSKYKSLAGEKAKNNPKTIKKLLDFSEDFNKVDCNNLYPLLARYDQFIEFNVQKNSYIDQEIKTIEKGHVTAFMVPEVLKDHIINSILLDKVR